ncbi:ATP-binding protein [Nitratidesulfovibrio sp. 1201_IL3209]|uniref:ATP-binding protein n=1 Tax=Nitratidesulfovibrio sp. 1201_IL3209 TaxID=3084053 RepID=UPI002FD8C798
MTPVIPTTPMTGRLRTLLRRWARFPLRHLLPRRAPPAPGLRLRLVGWCLLVCLLPLGIVSAVFVQVTTVQTDSYLHAQGRTLADAASLQLVRLSRTAEALARVVAGLRTEYDGDMPGLRLRLAELHGLWPRACIEVFDMGAEPVVRLLPVGGAGDVPATGVTPNGATMDGALVVRQALRGLSRRDVFRSADGLSIKAVVPVIVPLEQFGSRMGGEHRRPPLPAPMGPAALPEASLGSAPQLNQLPHLPQLSPMPSYAPFASDVEEITGRVDMEGLTARQHGRIVGAAVVSFPMNRSLLRGLGDAVRADVAVFDLGGKRPRGTLFPGDGTADVADWPDRPDLTQGLTQGAGQGPSPGVSPGMPPDGRAVGGSSGGGSLLGWPGEMAGPFGRAQGFGQGPDLPFLQRYEQVAGRPYLVSYQPLPGGSGMPVGALAVFVDVEPQRSRLRTAVEYTLLAAAVALGLSICTGFFIADRVVRPLHELLHAIRRISLGNYSERLPPAGMAEIGQLAQAVNHMASTLEENRTSLLGALQEKVESGERLARANRELELLNWELTRAQANYRRIFEESAQGIYQSTPQGRFLRVNPAMARTFGYSSPYEMVSSVTDIGEQFYVRPGEREELLRRLRQEGRVSMETCLRRRDASVVHVALTARAVTGETGEQLYIEGAVHDITERVERHRAEREREAAEAASRAKTQLLARMSHEVRTPLNALLGMADVLDRTPLAPEQRGYLDVLRSSGHSLLALLNDVLDFSRLEAGRVVPERVRFRLGELMEQVCRQMEPAAGAGGRGLRLDWAVLPGVPGALVGDPLRLRQILGNLVSNAVKFTPAGRVMVLAQPADGNVPGRDGDAPSMSARGALAASSPSPASLISPASPASRRDPGDPSGRAGADAPRAPAQAEDACRLPQGRRVEVLFSVADTGIGIPPEHQEVVFESFMQADSSITRQYGGTGLGLSICRALVDMLGGAIWLESVPGRGTTVYFTLPMQPAPDDACTADPAVAQTAGPDAMGGNAVTGPEAVPPPAGPQTGDDGSGPQRPLSILLVEDSPSNRLLFSLYLRGRPCAITEAHNGEEGVAAYAAGRFDLVFMDIEMPVMDGYRATRAIRDLERERGLPPTPVVALTAHVVGEFRDDCAAAGCSGFLAKPFSRGELLRCMDRHCGNGGEDAENACGGGEGMADGDGAHAGRTT